MKCALYGCPRPPVMKVQTSDHKFTNTVCAEHGAKLIAKGYLRV